MTHPPTSPNIYYTCSYIQTTQGAALGTLKVNDFSLNACSVSEQYDYYRSCDFLLVSIIMLESVTSNCFFLQPFMSLKQ